MRIFLLLLIFANLVVFAWSRGYFGDGNISGREPERLEAQINPSKLRILSTTKAVAPVEVCRVIGDLKLADAQRLQSSLGQQLAGATIMLSRPDEQQTWELSITGLSDRAAAESKLAELKKFASDDARVTTANNNTFGVLLATFHNESAAREQLQAFIKMGVKSAKVIPRQPPDAVRLVVRGPDSLLSRLPDLTRDNANATLGDCPAS